MTSSQAGAAPDTRHRGLLARHPLFFFFLIAYAGAWLVEAPVVLSQTGTGLLPFTMPRPLQAVAIAAATFTGPTLSAFIMTSIAEGRAGVSRLLRRYVLWRVRFRWYLFVLLVIPASEVVGAIVLPGVAGSYQPLMLSMVLAYPARTYLIASDPGPSVGGLPVIVDAAGEFRDAYGATGGSGCLVRPDGYLGFRAAPMTATALRRHLELVFAT